MTSCLKISACKHVTRRDADELQLARSLSQSNAIIAAAALRGALELQDGTREGLTSTAGRRSRSGGPRHGK